MSRRLAVALLISALAVAGSAQEGTTPPVATPPAEVSGRDAKALVKAFDAAWKKARKVKDEAARAAAELDALNELAGGRHDRVAECLAEVSADDGVRPSVRLAALDAFARQGDAGTKHVRIVAKWVASEAARAADDLANGRIGVPLDDKGEPSSGTPESDAAIATGAEHARAVKTALETLRAREFVPKNPDDDLAPFLQSPFDELVITAIDCARAWEAYGVARELGTLLQMYPVHNRWETGAITHFSGTDATAKSAWMATYGHPLKQRPRPDVHHAVVACLGEWAGKPIDDPAAFARWYAKWKHKR